MKTTAKAELKQTINNNTKTTNKMKKLTIYDIKRLSADSSPYFFSRSTMKFFGQTLADFRVYRLDKINRYWIVCGKTERYFNPETNELEFCNRER